MTSTVKRCRCGGRLGYSLGREADLCTSCPAMFPRAPSMEDLRYLDRDIAVLREYRLDLWRDMTHTDIEINEQVAFRKKLARKIRQMQSSLAGAK